MAKFVCYLSLVLVLILSWFSPSHAVLIDRGGGLIYDTDLNILWLQDANYAKTSGNDADGLMNWHDAIIWTNQLAYNGLQGWRLPTTIGTQEGSIDEGEMSHLYYKKGISSSSPFPFINLLSGDYWTGTEQVNNELAWNFHFGIGNQNNSNKESSLLRVWAVRDGDIYPEIENSIIVPSSTHPTIQSAIDAATGGGP